MEDGQKKFYMTLFGITALGLLFRIWGITGQPPIPDEAQAAFSAANYMESGQFGPTMPQHPNLRNILLYASTGALGTGAFGLRAWSLIFGTLSIPILGLLMRRMTSNIIASCLAAFFLATDPVHIAFSRQAIQEVHTAFFFLAGALFAVKGSKNMPLLPVAGILFGLGAASKAHAVFPLIVCLAYVLYVFSENRRPAGEVVFAALSLTILPLAVYMLTYAPWFQRGYGIWDWVFMQKSLFGYMASHQGNPMDSMIDTKPVLWFLKPFMGYANFAHSGGKPFVTMAMGNPLVWMLVLPSTAYLIYMPASQGKRLLLALFIVSYFPLAFASRPIWVISSIAVTPFAYGILGMAASIAVKNYKIIAAYAALALLISALMYPMSIGKSMDYGYTRGLVEGRNPHALKILKMDIEKEKSITPAETR